MSEISTSEQLMELVFKGIDHGIYSIKDGDGPLIPFVMTETDGEFEMQRFLADTLEECVEQANGYLSGLNGKPDLALLAYDGMLTVDGQKFDAILVDCYEKGDSTGYCFGQRYKPKKFLSRFKEVGNVAFLDEIDNVLNPQSN